jgi:hypothetical protein
MLRTLLVAALSLCWPIALIADVLVLRNGTRVQGELLSVRNGVIEFQERRGFGGGRTLRVDRAEVVRIELDDEPSDDIIGGGRPPGMRERQVNVAANVPWSDTGITVRAGQTVYFEAEGNIRWGPNRRDGPEGENNSPRNPARPMPNRPAAGLIGRVGPGDDVFFIGNDRSLIRMRSSGRLSVGINDDFLGDNSGSFRVIVYY